jgi:hypothetical protein
MLAQFSKKVDQQALFICRNYITRAHNGFRESLQVGRFRHLFQSNALLAAAA